MQIFARNALIALVLSAGLAAFSQEILWGDGTEGFVIGLVFDQSEFRTGEPIVATVATKNTSEVVRYVRTWRQRPEKEYTFFITRNGNESVEPLPPQLSIESLSYQQLNPNVTVTNKVRLDTKYDFSKPGMYTMMAARWIPLNNFSTNPWPPQTNWGQIRSGSATLYVTDGSVSDSPKPSQRFTKSMNRAAARERSTAIIAGNTNLTVSLNGSPGAENPVDSSNTQAAAGNVSTFPRNSGPVPQREQSAAGQSSESGTMREWIAQHAESVTAQQKIGFGVITALSALVLGILWRGAKRKRSA